MKKLILLIITISSLNAMSTNQIKLIKMIKKEARKYTRYKSTIAAICLVESSAGIHVLGDDGDSLGILQIQVLTARYAGTLNKELHFLTRMPKKYIETLLLKNDNLSIKIACTLINHYIKYYGYKHAVSKYNGGYNNTTYFNKVKRALRIINKIRG